MPSQEAPWIDGLTFAQVLKHTVARHGGRDALVFPWLSYRRSYAEFEEDVREIARAFMALGLQNGEHVGIWATNWPQWVVTQFAAATAGLVLVNINPAYRSQELAYVLNQADIAALVLTDQFKSSNYFDILASVCPEVGKPSAAFPKLRHVISIKKEKQPGMLNWEELRALAQGVSPDDLRERETQARAEDVVNIQYTSGTTGFPKGAMLTHRNLLMNAFYVGQRQSFSERDRLCIPVPFYHCFGCVMGTLMCAIHGAAMVIPAESYDPGATLQAIQDEKCTGVYGVPTMFIAELSHPRFGEFNLKSLRTGIMAGSPCPIEIMRAVIEKMGARAMTIAYGLTEASPVITQTRPDDDLEHRVGTVGPLIPGVEVRIVAPGSGLDPLPQGQSGELVVRGHGVMKGYYNKPAETAQCLTADGWLRSGDLALETADGYYKITGRLKDMIIRGGENIYPREIEEFLFSHPAIADVQVVGLPDRQFGEQVCAWIRLKPGSSLTEEEVKKFCKGQIAHYKVPHYVLFVEEFPTTVTGKIQKYKLREMGVERFGLEKAAKVETA